MESATLKKCVIKKCAEMYGYYCPQWKETAEDRFDFPRGHKLGILEISSLSLTKVEIKTHIFRIEIACFIKKKLTDIGLHNYEKIKLNLWLS